MLGAIIGDIAGSPYEDNPEFEKTKDFGPLFVKREKWTQDVVETHITDDSVMTIAVADAFLNFEKQGLFTKLKGRRKFLADTLKTWVRKYPYVGYGSRFFDWAMNDEKHPYTSWGSGAAMRVSSIGWLYDSIEEVKDMARLSASITHNHPGGMNGAECTAVMIYLARKGHTKEKLEAVAKDYDYNLLYSLDAIREANIFSMSCKITVPCAIRAFLDSTDFEDAIRTAVSLGGDTDTLACITGSIAEAFYGIPEDIKKEALGFIPDDMMAVYNQFLERISLK